MKTGQKMMFALLTLLIIGLSASCATTGQFMPLSSGETVIGTAQATFVVRSTVMMSKSGKDSVNTQAYIHLMEAASKQHSGAIDIRDIVWVTGRSVDHENTEVSASGKVVQLSGR
jgi:hypothetical protein